MKKTKKAWALFLALLLTLGSFSVTPTYAADSGWEKWGDDWVYYDEDSGIPVVGWKQIGGVWYHFNLGFRMDTGWLVDEGKTYYLGTSGAMTTGWAMIEGEWYYFSSGGAMQSGRWLKSGNNTYYLKDSGVMAASEYINGWWLNANGTWTYPYQASWKKNSSGWWYGDTSGWYAKNGTYTIDGKEYYFNSRGYWADKPSEPDTTPMQGKWVQQGSTWYFVKQSGQKAANEYVNGWWLNSDGSWTYPYQASWKQNSKGWWFGDSSGWYAKNKTYTINGKKYTFDYRGYWLDRSKAAAPEDALTYENMLSILDCYDPDGAFIVRNTDESLAMSWVSEYSTIEEAVSEFETVVHEQCHSYTYHSYGSERMYIGDGQSIVVPYTDVFDSYEMAENNSDFIKTFRYDTYIAGSIYMSSRQDGVYGIFNEYTAYYWGFNDLLKLQEYKEDHDFLTPIWSNVYIAQAEFRYYTLAYMLYAKENYPDVYNGIMNNKEYLKAFKIIDTAFEKAVTEFRSNADYLSSSFESEYKALTDELQKKEYVDMLAAMKK